MSGSDDLVVVLAAEDQVVGIQGGERAFDFHFGGRSERLEGMAASDAHRVTAELDRAFFADLTGQRISRMIGRTIFMAAGQ